MGKLEKARDENIKAARSALLANPATRDLIADDLAERTDPTATSSRAWKRRPPPACWRKPWKARRRWRIAICATGRWAKSVAEARAGLTGNARQTARRIAPAPDHVALRDIAGPGPRQPRRRAGRRRSDPDPFNARGLGLHHSTSTSPGQRRRRPRRARLARTIDELTDSTQPVAFRARLAVVFARVDDAAGADRAPSLAAAAARALPPAPAGTGLRYVAVALADMRRTNEALQLLNDIPDKSEHIPVLTAAVVQEARGGNPATAHALANTIVDIHHRAGVLGPVAAAQRRAGRSGQNGWHALTVPITLTS